MKFVLRTIKEPDSVIWATKCKYRKSNCLAVSKGRRIEIYSEEMVLFDTIYTSCFVCIICPIKYNDRDCLFLVNSENEFSVVADGKIMKRGSICKDKLNKDAKPYKAVHVPDKFIIIILRTNRVIVVYLKNQNLTFDDSLNDLASFEIINCVVLNEDIYFLLRGIGNKKLLSVYNIKENKRGFIFKENINIPSDIHDIAIIREKILLFGNNKISLYKKNNGNFEIYLETDFANPELICNIEHEGTLILCMGDGELIRLDLNENPFHTFKIHIIGRLKNRIDFIIKLRGHKYYGGSYYGNSFFFELENELNVLENFENISCINNMKFSDGVITFLSGKMHVNRICKLSHDIFPRIRKSVKFDQQITKSWIFYDFYIVSFLGTCHVITRSTLSPYKCYDEVMNLKIMSDKCYFNTRNHIFIMERDSSTRCIETKKIVLSSYYQEKCVIYTEDKNLSVINLENSRIIYETKTEYEASFLLFEKYIFISTYFNQLMILDNDLSVKKTFDFETIRHGIIADYTLFFVNSNDILLCVNIQSILKNKKLKDEDIKVIYNKANFIDDFYLLPNKQIVAFGKKSILIDYSDFEYIKCYRIAINSISGVNLDKNLIISTDYEILECSSKISPSYRITKKKIEPQTRFLVLMPDPEKKIIGSSKFTYGEDKNIDLHSDKHSLTSSLFLYQKKLLINTFCMPGELLMAGVVCRKDILIVASNIKEDDTDYSKISVFEVENDLKKLCEVKKRGYVFSVDVLNDYIITSHGSELTVYEYKNKMLVKLSSTPCQILPWHIKVNNNLIMVCDVLRSLSVYMFDNLTNTITEEKRFYEDVQIEKAEFFKKKYLVADFYGNLMLLSENKHEISKYATFNYQENILSLEKGCLSLHENPEKFYFSTECGSIVVLLCVDNILDDFEFETLKNLEEKYSNNTIFQYKKAISYNNEITTHSFENFIDLDLLNEELKICDFEDKDIHIQRVIKKIEDILI